MKLTEILILLTVCLFYGQAAENHISDLSNSVPATVKLTAVSGLKVSAPNDGLNKRDVKATELSGIITGKNYAPPPHEYNRYSSSTSTKTYDSPTAAATANENAYEDSETAGFISKPVTFPDSYSRNKYLSPQTTTLEGRAGDSWNAIKEAAIAKLEGRDRTGLGHNAAAEYEYERHTPNHPYISGQNAAYGPAGYGLGAYGDDTLNHHYSPGDAVPFDVYNKAHYAGYGPEYSYSNYDYHQPISHKGHYDYSHKELLAKSFLIPLASATVLGIAAALASNPLLLQLGTISGAGVLGKRRRRRDLTQQRLALAYRGHLPATLQANNG